VLKVFDSPVCAVQLHPQVNFTSEKKKINTGFKIVTKRAVKEKGGCTNPQSELITTEIF
jgi:hypothetical protein